MKTPIKGKHCKTKACGKKLAYNKITCSEGEGTYCINNLYLCVLFCYK